MNAVAAGAPELSTFGSEPLWIIIIKVLGVFGFLVVMVLFAIVFERKVMGYMQTRPGPNQVGPWGTLQALADGIKLAFKEEIIPKLADKPVYWLAPVVAAVPAFLAFSVIPFGPVVSIFGHHTALQLTDLPVGILIVLACSSLGVYGVVLSGWSSGSTYPLLGGLRSAAQMISYEIAMGLSIVAVFLYAGSMSTSQVVDAQAGGGTFQLFGSGPTFDAPSWYVVLLLPSFIVYAISVVGETNRAPFDLAEAEGELVAGFHTEYSSMKFAMFFLAEYVNVVTVSSMAATMFFGGWRAPWPISLWDGANSGWWPMLWFTIKVIIGLFIFVWLRTALPRVRYDQFMKFGWKVLVPFSLCWIVVIGAFSVLRSEGRDTGEIVLYFMGPVLAVVLIAAFLWPEGKQAEADAQGDRRRARGNTGGKGGFPTPPMDLVVPPPPKTTVRGAGQPRVIEDAPAEAQPEPATAGTATATVERAANAPSARRTRARRNDGEKKD